MDKNYKALELDKVLEMLAQEATCKDGQEAALALQPAGSLKEAKRLLKQTDEAFVLIAKFGSPSFYGLKNTVNSLRRASAGGVLSLMDLISIDTTLKIIRGISQWRSKSEGVETTLDYLFKTLAPNKFLEDRINETVQNEEEVADTASKALGNIRRKIRQAGLKVKEQLDKMTKSPQYQKYLQDSIVTQRDGRFVVPVKNEYRNEVRGLVHDSSSSGATLFIEPMAVVEANNEIRVLKGKEAEEIERILMVLSAEIGEFADGIIASYNVLIELNLIFAKANLGYKMKAILPEIEADGKINLKASRHPLIDPKKVVATDIVLGYEFDSLIITGPNTGGKTVSLKTLGLFTLMAKCGLLVPCGTGSKLAFFENILVDIGDEQSIEQSLSTFSSHMTNIISILKKANDKSLVLVDELGAGTDPVEGAALAMAIIETMRDKGVRLAATTHYAELKEYALKTVGVENACCEFDVKSLSPTYRLLIGMPGKSNAFAISKRLGMDDEIVERASELVSEEKSNFEELVQKIEIRRQNMEKETILAAKKRLEAEKLLKEAKSAMEKAEKDAKAQLETAKQQASMVVAKTRAQAESLVSEIEKLQKNKNKIMSAEEKAKLRKGIRTLENSSDPVYEKKHQAYKLPRPLKIGDNVLIVDLDKGATVLAINGDQITVQAGIIKTKIKLSNLKLLDKKKEEVKRSAYRNVGQDMSRETASSSLDIRGMTCDEGLMELDTYLDRCVRQNLNSVTIIHGKGTGALRTAVQQHLRKHPSVRSHRFGAFGEGEMGVTIVEIK